MNPWSFEFFIFFEKLKISITHCEKSIAISLMKEILLDSQWLQLQNVQISALKCKYLQKGCRLKESAFWKTEKSQKATWRLNHVTYNHMKQVSSLLLYFENFPMLKIGTLGPPGPLRFGPNWPKIAGGLLLSMCYQHV